MTDYAYRPRLGFDIRIRPDNGPKRRAPVRDEARLCEAKGCTAKAEVRAPKSPKRLKEFYWYCPEHAREHNRNWNFFEGMSETEARKFREAEAYGHRPTWKMSQNGRASAAARFGVDAELEIDDALGVMSDATPRRTEDGGDYREGRKLTRLQAKAFQSLHLPTNAPEADIRRRYAELVKRFHPDANGGQRGAEDQLAEVIKAHQILKKAGFC